MNAHLLLRPPGHIIYEAQWRNGALRECSGHTNHSSLNSFQIQISFFTAAASIESLDSAVAIATGYELDDQGVGV
jgi:hypothetical protein